MAGSGRHQPVVAVLSPHWGLGTERGTITRQVAGALACSSEVHVITPTGTAPGTRQDGVFTVHRLGRGDLGPAELRRDLLLTAVAASAGPGQRSDSPDLGRLLDRGLVDPWTAGTEVLGGLRPDVIVLADHRAVGALSAVDRYDPDAPVVLLALAGGDGHLSFPHFDPVVERAGPVLAVTETERRSVADRIGSDADVHRIGAPLAANASVCGEPNPWVGDTDYVLVLTDRGSEDSHVQNELARLIRMRFSDRPVGITHRDGFVAWHEGRAHSGWPVERSSDLARLMAFAAVTVDLRQPELYGRSAVESLLYGTPIVVADDSRSREHAQRGRGGLWFADPAELLWCIDSLLDEATNDVMGAQGRTYAEDEYGSTDRFIDRVTAACGLDVDDIPVVIRVGTPA